MAEQETQVREDSLLTEAVNQLAFSMLNPGASYREPYENDVADALVYLGDVVKAGALAISLSILELAKGDEHA